MRTITLFLFLGMLLAGACERTSASYDNYVILVSFDGFRWDYPDLYDTPNFDAMATSGVKAERVISSFPTKTFPNHYSVVTGLYPDHHGLINNSFFAADLGMLYRIGDRSMVENPGFYGGEPIWNTAEKQGMITASFFWVGSEAPIQGMQPTYWKNYQESISFRARLDSVIHWLKLPLEDRPRLILLYFHQPDGVGHAFGPESEETGNVVEEMDAILGTLRKKIGKLPFGDQVNLLVTSDHGMGTVSPGRYVNIFDFAEEEWIEEIVGSSPVYLVDAVEGYEDTLVTMINQAVGISAWKKEEIPEHLHYGTHPRIPDVLVLADSSWSVGLDSNPSGYTGGSHGYDSRNTDMHNIFYAEGPGFRKGYIHPPFENVDIYPMIANLLGLEPAETDGNLENVEGMFIK